MDRGVAPDLRVRAYDRDDRTRVRDVCYRTGYMGDPIDWQWRDRESFADMFTGYYTEQEPGSALVVEVGGLVEGYLLGCLDSRRAWNPGAVAGRHVVRRAIAFRRGTAAAVWRTFGDVVVDVARRRVKLRDLDFHDARWPAHLHIDLLPPARGRGAGRRLVHEWFALLRDRGIHGCHLQTMAENTGAIAFFSAMGFRRLGDPQLIPGLRARDGARLHSQVMVTDLGAAPTHDREPAGEQ
jgi:ribosomal protein S18 acetylase RimI-like enzyme